MVAKFGLFVDEDHSKLRLLYCLLKLNKIPYKSRCIAYSSSSTTTKMPMTSSELQLTKVNTSGTEVSFWGWHFSISNDIVPSKINGKRDEFDFEIVNFPIIDGDVPRSTSNGVYISQLIRFARASRHVADFDNKLLAQKPLKQDYQYHKNHKEIQT